MVLILSSITRELKDQTIRRGGFLGAAGALLLLFGGIFLPTALLKIGGIPIFLCGLLFIAIGLRPYRQLSRLELRPHQLSWDGEGICFAKMGKPLLYIKKEDIASLSWQASPSLYGVAVQLKRPIQITLYDQRGRIEECMAGFACDLFFPFFKEKTFQTWALETGLHEIVQLNDASDAALRPI